MNEPDAEVKAFGQKKLRPYHMRHTMRASDGKLSLPSNVRLVEWDNDLFVKVYPSSQPRLLNAIALDLKWHEPVTYFSLNIKVD